MTNQFCFLLEGRFESYKHFVKTFRSFFKSSVHSGAETACEGKKFFEEESLERENLCNNGCGSNVGLLHDNFLIVLAFSFQFSWPRFRLLAKFESRRKSLAGRTRQAKTLHMPQLLREKYWFCQTKPPVISPSK